MNNNYYWSLIAASKKKLLPIWVEYIVARAGDFNLPTYDTIQENIVTDTDHLASVQLYDSNNELTANLRPCLSTEKGHYLEGCLYDVVKKKFYYSQNAGVKYGDIVREVEYIEGTGAQYIDTGIYVNSDIETELKVFKEGLYNSSTGVFEPISNSILTSNYKYRFFLYYSNSSLNYLAFTYGSANTSSMINNWNNGQPEYLVVKIKNGRLYINNQHLISKNIDSVFTSNDTISLFSNKYRNSAKCRICYTIFKKISTSLYLADYTPCILADGTICMWDWISGEAKKNAGTGEFVAGKDMNDLFNIVEKEDVFLNRTTGDGLNVKDKSLAHITSLKGNTLIFNQLLKDGKVVDMGLPSGTLWATCDIDVTKSDGFATTPFTYEKSFFSWGNIDGHNPKNNSFDGVYNWGGINAAEPRYDGQPYGNTKGNTLTKNIPVGDEFDAASANLGEPWRMPLSTEFQELFDGCIYIDADGNEVDTSKADKRVTVNGIVGLYLQSKTNGNRLFFSASGNGNGSSWNFRGSRGYYWSSSFVSSRGVRGLYFYSGGVYPQSSYERYVGFAVRAVLKPSNIITTGSNNHKYYMKNNKNIFDLTKMFGAGNEPATAEEFEAMFPADYYDYDAGSLLNVDAGGIKSTNVEKTKWDSLYFIDDTHTLSSLTGKVEGSSVSEVIFPDGMKRVNNVYDELTDVKDGCFTKAVKRIMVIDADSASWSTRFSGNTVTGYSMNTPYIYNPQNVYLLHAKLQHVNRNVHESFGATTINDNTVPGIYNYYNTNTQISERTFYVVLPKGERPTGYIYITLRDPIVYTLDTPVPCNYKVWKGGTESIVPENTEALTAPVDMSVKYIVDVDE